MEGILISYIAFEKHKENISCIQFLTTAFSDSHELTQSVSHANPNPILPAALYFPYYRQKMA